MIPKNQAQWERIDRFLMSFSREEKIAIIHDYDPDGLASAVIISRMIERLRGKPADFVFPPPKGSKSTIAPEVFAELKKRRIKKVIIADLGVHEDSQAVKKLEKQCEILIIDHHQFFQDLTSERTVLAMPQLLADEIEPALYPSCKLSYDLANRHALMEDCDWIASAGIISDLAGSAWPDFLSRACGHNSLKQAELEVLPRTLFSAMSMDKKNVQYCYTALMNSSSPQDVLNDKKLSGLRKKYDAEINAWLSKAQKNAELHKDARLFWYEILPKYHVSSQLSTSIASKPQYKDWVVLVLERSKDFVRLSARCLSGRVRVNDLLRSATKGLKNAGGGGHPLRGGAHVLIKDLEVFKKKVIDGVSKGLYTQNEKPTTIKR